MRTALLLKVWPVCSLVALSYLGLCIGLAMPGVHAGHGRFGRKRMQERPAVQGTQECDLFRAFADVVPVYHLGSSQMLRCTGHAAWSRYLKASVALFWGRSGLPLPYKHDIITLVGEAVPGKAGPHYIKAVLCDRRPQTKAAVAHPDRCPLA